MFNHVRYEGIAEMGMNPASVEMGTKDLILNKDTFPKLPKFTQKFIVKHEEGHLLHDTDNEKLADEYALQSLYKSEDRSLKKSIKALADFLPEDDSRIEALYNKALEIDKGKDMRTFNFTDYLRGGQPYLRTIRRNADGDAETPPAETEATDTTTVVSGQRRKRFVNVFGYAMTPAEVMILVVGILIIFKYLK